MIAYSNTSSGCLSQAGTATVREGRRRRKPIPGNECREVFGREGWETGEGMARRGVKKPKHPKPYALRFFRGGQESMTLGDHLPGSFFLPGRKTACSRAPRVCCDTWPCDALSGVGWTPPAQQTLYFSVSPLSQPASHPNLDP